MEVYSALDNAPPTPSLEKKRPREDGRNDGNEDENERQPRKRHKHRHAHRHHRRRHALSSSSSGSLLFSMQTTKGAVEGIIGSMIHRRGIDRKRLHDALRVATDSGLGEAMNKMRECKKGIEKEIERRKLSVIEDMIKRLCRRIVTFYEDAYGEESFAEIDMDSWIDSYRVLDMVRYNQTDDGDTFECYIQCSFSFPPYIQDGVVTIKLYENVVFDLTRDEQEVGANANNGSEEDEEDDEEEELEDEDDEEEGDDDDESPSVNTGKRRRHVYKETTEIYPLVDFELVSQNGATNRRCVGNDANEEEEDEEEEIFADENEQLCLVVEGKMKNSAIKNHWNNQRHRWLIQALSCVPLFIINEQSLDLSSAYPQIHQYVKMYEEIRTKCIEEF